MLESLIQRMRGWLHLSKTPEVSFDVASEVVPRPEPGIMGEWGSENHMPDYTGDGKECPFCKSSDTRTIAYGLIRFESKQDRDETLKTHILGGCSMDDNSPKYFCNSCHRRFGKL
jgi:hypothetical protein